MATWFICLLCNVNLKHEHFAMDHLFIIPAASFPAFSKHLRNSAKCSTNSASSGSAAVIQREGRQEDEGRGGINQNQPAYGTYHIMLISLCCKFYHLQERRGLSEIQRSLMDTTTRTYILEYLNSLFQSSCLIQPILQLTMQCLQDQKKALVFHMWMHL